MFILRAAAQFTAIRVYSLKHSAHNRLGGYSGVSMLERAQKLDSNKNDDVGLKTLPNVSLKFLFVS